MPPSSDGTGPTSQPSSEPKLSELRGVDFANFRYGGFGPGGVTLREGRYELHEYLAEGGGHTTDTWTLEAVGYGDIDGDGREEAAVVISHSWYAPGGSHGQRLELQIFAAREGGVEPIAKASLPGGEVREVQVARGALSLLGEASRRVRFADGVLTPEEGP